MTRLVGAKRRGRPPGGEEREPLQLVTFYADRVTLEAIERLKAVLPTLPSSVRQLKSTAIRKALQEAAGRLSGPLRK